jgi:hypothetical protein
MSRLLLAAALAAGVALPAPAADDKKPGKVVIYDPAKLPDDPDYAVQGEYEGTAGAKGKVGVQVIARGNGKFEIVGYPGGLPGAGWDGDRDRVSRGSAAREGGKVLVYGPDKTPVGEIVNGSLSMKGATVEAVVKRVERTSPTLGAKPPAGAVVLVGGEHDADMWSGYKLAELSDGKFLAAAGGPRSKAKFGSFTAHVEFRLPYMPNSTGQARGNSGVYLQDRYEVQVLDSFGLKGLNNECGGIYQQGAPKVNMCLPPMVWQTYDIEFTAAGFSGSEKVSPAVLTVRHNGVTIHDKLQLKSATPGGGVSKETPEPGSLYFQNHGDPVVYRNVWVVETK